MTLALGTLVILIAIYAILRRLDQVPWWSRPLANHLFKRERQILFHLQRCREDSREPLQGRRGQGSLAARLHASLQQPHEVLALLPLNALQG